jgi:hypothetical protein
MAYTTINKSTDYFNTKLYTGNGGTQSITGVGHQPDWSWFKSRGDTNSHALFDVVRGVGKALISNNDGSEDTQGNALTAFNTDGFSLGDGSSVNSNNQTYASWNWKAGTTSGLSGGTITPSAYSINATAGFGIYSYTGTNANGTITHGLGSAPSVIIVKNRLTSSKSWVVGHKSIGFQNALFLNLTDASTSEAGLFNSTTPTSSVFTVGTGSLINDSGNSYIAYAFAEKTGYSKFGSYTGNGNADGTFIFTSFKPAWVMIKKTDTADAWYMFDNKRQGFNPSNELLRANLNNAESTPDRIDLLSNGFKLTDSDGSVNGSGGSYIYMAFGQSLVGSNNVPCTAR